MNVPWPAGSALNNYFFLFITLLLAVQPAVAQDDGVLATKADTLRGSITPQRAWWEVTYYDLHVTVQPKDSSISGYNKITYRVTGEPRQLQVDLQQPLEINKITQDGNPLTFQRVDDSNAWFVDVPANLSHDSLYTLTVSYHGQPKIAVNAQDRKSTRLNSSHVANSY